MKKIFTICFLFLLGVHLTSGQVLIPGKSISNSYFTGTLERVAYQHVFLPKPILAKKTESGSIDTFQSWNTLFSASLSNRQKFRFEQYSFLPVIQRIHRKSFPMAQVCDISAGIRTAGNQAVVVSQNRYTAYGLTGLVSLLAGYGAQEKSSANLHLTHRSRKLALSADYLFIHNHTRQQFYNYRRIDDPHSSIQTWDSVIRNPLLRQHTLQLGMEYNLSSQTRMYASLSGFTNTATVNDESIRTNILKGDQAESPVHLSHLEKNQWRHWKGNMAIHHQLSKGQEIQMEIGHLHYHDSDSHLFTQTNESASQEMPGAEAFTVQRHIPIRISVGSVRYSKLISEQSKLEAGLKGTITNLDNNVELERCKQDHWQVDSTASYCFAMQENSVAAYLSLNQQLTSTTKLQTSLRWEYIHTQVHTAQHVEYLQRHSGYLLPSLLLLKEFSKQRNIQLSYARSLHRPTYNNLAAYIFGTDAFSGNMTLRAAILDALAATYQINEKYQLSLGYNFYKNPILPLQFHINPETNQQYVKAENLKNSQNYYLTFSLQTPVRTWWQVQGKIYSGWQQNCTQYEGRAVQAQKAYASINIVQTFTFPRNFSTELAGFYQTPSLYGIGTLKAFGGLNISVQKKLRNNQGIIKFTADDVFATTGIMLINHYPDLQLNQVLKARFIEPRIFRLTYVRTFGKQQVKRVHYSFVAGNEEYNRATN